MAGAFRYLPTAEQFWGINEGKEYVAMTTAFHPDDSYGFIVDDIVFAEDQIDPLFRSPESNSSREPAEISVVGVADTLSSETCWPIDIR